MSTELKGIIKEYYWTKVDKEKAYARPTEPGWYWARGSAKDKQYTHIVQITGKAPWLQIGQVWGLLSENVPPSLSTIWGPKVFDEIPKPEWTLEI